MKGRDRKLTGQIGEFLVCAEVGRQLRLVATPFAGNVPGFDLVVVDDRGRSLPVQVKTFRHARDGHPCWPMNDFLDIKTSMRTKRQRVAIRTNPSLARMLHVFVLLGAGASRAIADRFFVCLGRHAQLACLREYQAFLKRNKHRRPRNPEATEVRLRPRALRRYENNWSLVTKQLARR